LPHKKEEEEEEVLIYWKSSSHKIEASKIFGARFSLLKKKRGCRTKHPRTPSNRFKSLGLFGLAKYSSNVDIYCNQGTLFFILDEKSNKRIFKNSKFQN
jgi:hypothetical protein